MSTKGYKRFYLQYNVQKDNFDNFHGVTIYVQPSELNDLPSVAKRRLDHMDWPYRKDLQVVSVTIHGDAGVIGEYPL